MKSPSDPDASDAVGVSAKIDTSGRLSVGPVTVLPDPAQTETEAIMVGATVIVLTPGE